MQSQRLVFVVQSRTDRSSLPVTRTDSSSLRAMQLMLPPCSWTASNMKDRFVILSVRPSFDPVTPISFLASELLFLSPSPSLSEQGAHTGLFMRVYRFNKPTPGYKRIIYKSLTV